MKLFGARKIFLAFGLAYFLVGSQVCTLCGVNIVFFPYSFDEKGEMYVFLKQEPRLVDYMTYYLIRSYSCFVDDNFIQDFIIKLNLTTESSKRIVRMEAYDWFHNNTNFIFYDYKLKSDNYGHSGECFLSDCKTFVFFKKVEFTKKASFNATWFLLDSLFDRTDCFFDCFVNVLKRKEVRQTFLSLREKEINYTEENNILSPQPILLSPLIFYSKDWCTQ